MPPIRRCSHVNHQIAHHANRHHNIATALFDPVRSGVLDQQMKQSKTIAYHFSICFVLLIVEPLSSFYVTSQTLPRAGGKLLERRTPCHLQATTTPVRVGFVGCGTIAAAIARGLATLSEGSQIKVESIAVSRRNEAKSRVLADTFPELVTVHDDNQNILNNSDLIFLCVLPQQTSEVLESLSFDSSRHTLVSLAVSY